MKGIQENISAVSSRITENNALKKIVGDFASAPTTDHMALISTVTNTVKIYQKIVLLPGMSQEEIKKSPYFKSISDTSLSRCMIAAIPGIGNLVTIGADLLRVLEFFKNHLPENEQLSTVWKLCSLASRYFHHPELPWLKKESFLIMKNDILSVI